MGWLAEAVMGGVFAFGAWLSWDLIRANLRHGHHELGPPAPLIVGEGDPRFGSMCLTSEAVLHHELPVAWEPGPDFVDTFTRGLAERYGLVDPAPWEHEPELGPRARAVLDSYEGRRGARKWATT